MFSKKVLIGTIIFSLMVFIGFIQINIVNTKALSPVGNGEDNYELVKEEFGEDFEEFIRDNAEVKIYTSQLENDSTIIKIEDKEFKVNTDNVVTEKIYMLGSKIYSGFSSIKNKINGKIKNDDKNEDKNEEINSNNEETNLINEGNKEDINNTEGEGKEESTNTNNDKLDKIVDDFLKKSN